MKIKYLFILLFFITSVTNGQEQLIAVSTISEKTILLHFDEGEKDFTNFSEYILYNAPNAAYYGQINEEQSLVPSNFSITSPDDANYATPQNPIVTYFKAKEQKGLFEYKVYLEMPFNLVQGATYTVNVTNINANESSYTLINDSFALFSESIHVNQIGMIASASRKYAYVSQWLGKNTTQISNSEDFTAMEGATCHVVKISDGSIIYSGRGEDGLQFRLEDTPTGFNTDLANEFWTRSAVWQFDFSNVGTTISTDDSEEYKIVVEGIGSSFPFRIANDSYDDIVKLVAKSLYHQRSGIDRGAPYSNFPKPVDHYPGIDGFEITYSNFRRLDNSQGDEQSFMELPAQATSFVNPTNPAAWMVSPDDLPWGAGGHFDAGDYDIYTQHLLVPLYGSLAYRMAPQGFYDGQFDIPENNNDIPDVLDEVRWTLDFFKRTKGPTGGVCGGKETDNYYGPSWNNGSGFSSSEQMWYVYKEDPATSFMFAAAAAQFAIALQQNGDVTSEAQLYIDEAIAAYAWAEDNQEAGDQDILITGLPNFGRLEDIQLLAAASLYDAMGGQEYLDFYKTETSVTTANTDLFIFPTSDEQFATFSYALVDENKWPNFDSAAMQLQTTQKIAILNWADYWGLDYQENYPFRHIANLFDPPFVGVTASTPQVFSQIVAHHLTGDATILNAILVNNDLNLGGNQDNWVYITGADQLGADRFSTDPLHGDNWEYGGENIPGMPLYGLWPTSSYNFMASPPATEWPHFECNSNARVYLGHSEFTIHQNTAPVIAIYGYLNGVLNDDLLSVSSNDSPFYMDKFIMSPNPANTKVQFRSEQPITAEILIRIYDFNGRKINLPYTIENDVVLINTSSLQMGVYVVKISEGLQTETHKLVIE